jgi:shikimate kinase
MKNIVLTGFMGTGKSTIGRVLSRRLDMKLVDVDEEIEAAEHMKISSIFSIHGEKHFRDIETAMIKKLAQEKNIIISTGGGAVLRDENMNVLRENGIIFCLTADPDIILERTSRNKNRPLLEVENPKAKICELLAFRRPFYEKAGIMIETGGKTPMQIADEIMEIIKWKK